jgi:hypothetical protein
MSLPDMVGPISRRGAAFFTAVLVLLMVFAVLAGDRGIQQKTHDRCQPWVFIETGFSFDKHHRRCR